MEQREQEISGDPYGKQAQSEPRFRSHRWERRCFASRLRSIGSGERPCGFATERSAQATRCLFAWRSFPEPVKNRRSQYRMPLRVGLCSGLGAPIFYRLWVSVPSASTRSLTPWQCGACSHGGASQSRLKTGAPSTECRSAPGFAHGWERRYFIGSGGRPCGFDEE